MKTLIIVCDDKLRKYGDFLAQLVSLTDDKDDNAIGVKDGVVKAQVWTCKEYENNAPQISSSQYILFIGNNKLCKNKRLHMKKVFTEYGMNYGWLGKQASLFVDHVVDVCDYKNFYDFIKNKQPELKSLIECSQDNMLLEGKSIDPINIKGIYIPLNTMQIIINHAAQLGINIVTNVVNNKKIEDQQYSCAVLLFYFNGLSDFLEIKE